MKKFSKKPKSEFEQKLLDLARVTRVVRGGRRFRFRATVVIGNRRGKIGIGTAKGTDVSDSISKAFNKAKKSLINIKIVEGTIPHQVSAKFKSAKVLMKPTQKGRGIVVGGAVRQVVELAGISDLSAKIIGKGSKINNAMAAIKALQSLKENPKRKEKKGLTPKEFKTKSKESKEDKNKEKTQFKVDSKAKKNLKSQKPYGEKKTRPKRKKTQT
ncbi:MAG: 30S ribosomal protein S5 [Candidatus Moranbacteria bacterium]|nr:30S ribosomal protein S5 [Candidatus Moranbacteria bacterium]